MTKLDDLRVAVKVAREQYGNHGDECPVCEEDGDCTHMWECVNAWHRVTNAAEAYLAELDAAKAKPRVMADWEKAGIVLNPKHFETYPPEKKEPK